MDLDGEDCVESVSNSGTELSERDNHLQHVYSGVESAEESFDCGNEVSCWRHDCSVLESALCSNEEKESGCRLEIAFSASDYLFH